MRLSILVNSMEVSKDELVGGKRRSYPVTLSLLRVLRSPMSNPPSRYLGLTLPNLY